MSQATSRRWLITGCSTGFGRFLAEAVLARGDRVVLTARKPEVLADLAAQYPETSRTAKLDVTNPADIEAAVATAETAFGGIDVLVNNAGFSVIGAVEELAPEEYLPLYETNLFGAINTMRAVVPQMRQRGSGVIVNVSSMSGQMPSPGMSHYSATKFALEALTEGMLGELKEHGVRMLIVEPGMFRTAIIGALRYPAKSIAAYDSSSGAITRFMQGIEGKEPGDPRKAAQAIIGAVYDDAAPLRLPLGAGSTDRIKARLADVAANMDATAAVANATSFDPA